MVQAVLMGRSQVVRQRFLVPCTVGSNPTAPARHLFRYICQNNLTNRDQDILIELIAAVFGDQKRRVIKITDFLTQPIDMRFKRMGRHLRAVSPDLFKQILFFHHSTVLVIEIADDRRFLFGQAKRLACLLMRQGLVAGIEKNDTDGNPASARS